MRVTKMKDWRTHLAHKAEHVVDLDTGTVVAVTLREADKGDITSLNGGGTGRARSRMASGHQAEGQRQGH